MRVSFAKSAVAQQLIPLARYAIEDGQGKYKLVSHDQYRRTGLGRRLKFFTLRVSPPCIPPSGLFLAGHKSKKYPRQLRPALWNRPWGRKSKE
eukprot:9484240-Pyramimonas_sp.AAC.1